MFMISRTTSERTDGFNEDLLDVSQTSFLRGDESDAQLGFKFE